MQFTLAPLFEDYGLPLAIMGTTVVFLALTLVITLINALPKLLDRILGRPLPEAMDLAPTPQDELSGETLAVIAAAVAETIQRPHRIIKVRGLTPEDMGWSLEGRMQHHHSHWMKR